MRQSDKRGSVRNDEIINFHLLSGAGFEPVSPGPCKTQATFSNSICPKPGKNKESRNEI